MAVIEVRGLSKRFGPVLAVDQLSFTVDSGTVVGCPAPGSACSWPPCSGSPSTGEFRHATATATYLATPARTAVLIAKAVTAALAGLLFGLVTSGVAIGTGPAFVAAKGCPVALGGATIARFAAGAVLGAALLGVVGVGIGSLILSR